MSTQPASPPGSVGAAMVHVTIRRSTPAGKALPPALGWALADAVTADAGRRWTGTRTGCVRRRRAPTLAISMAGVFAGRRSRGRPMCMDSTPEPANRTIIRQDHSHAIYLCPYSDSAMHPPVDFRLSNAHHVHNTSGLRSKTHSLLPDTSALTLSHH
jgi:hypothetical protein